MNEERINNMSPQELIELYNKINEFIIYLESSIIEEEEEVKDEWVHKWNG